MGLFDKKFCCVCGSKAGMLTRQKINGDYICGDCRSKCSCHLTWREFEAMSIDDVHAHLAYMAENDAMFHNEFRETSSINIGILGGTRVISIDDRNGWWVPEGRPTHDLLTTDQVISYRLELDTRPLSEEDRHKPGRPHMPMPPMGMPGCAPGEEITGMKVIVNVDHPWIRVVELNVMNAIFVTDGDIRAGYECAQRIFMYFEQAKRHAAFQARTAVPFSMPHQPAPAPAGSDPVETLKKYKELLDMGAITPDEYEAKKRQLLNL